YSARTRKGQQGHKHAPLVSRFPLARSADTIRGPLDSASTRPGANVDWQYDHRLDPLGPCCRWRLALVRQVYDITNDITGSAFLGTVGLDWQVMGFGNFSSLGETDMILRNSSTGGMQVYDIKNNQIIGVAFMGTVGLNWQMY